MMMVMGARAKEHDCVSLARAGSKFKVQRSGSSNPNGEL
jgi:hypothetical protein